MKTYLVTGGAGFIGGNFVLLTLQKPGVKVINLDALTYAGNLDTLQSLSGNPNHIFVEGDIRDHDLVRSLFKDHSPDYVVNFAAESHVDRSIESPGDFILTNVVGTFEMLESARGHWLSLAGQAKEDFRFLHVSTDEVYGSLGKTGLFTETTPYAPNSPYSASKAGADHLARAYNRTFGLPVLTTNCSNNYGPFQFPEKLIPLVTGKALAGEPLPIYGDGQQVRDWLFVEDHCRAIQRVLEAGTPGEVYNIGGDSEKPNIEVVKTICRLLDEMAPERGPVPHEELITFVKDRPGHDRRYAIDASKIKKELSWKPENDFESGLRKTLRWYLDNSQWLERVMSGAYRGERLGLTD